MDFWFRIKMVEFDSVLWFDSIDIANMSVRKHTHTEQRNCFLWIATGKREKKRRNCSVSININC